MAFTLEIKIWLQRQKKKKTPTKFYPPSPSQPKKMSLSLTSSLLSWNNFARETPCTCRKIPFRVCGSNLRNLRWEGGNPPKWLNNLRILDDFEKDQKNHGSIDPHLISPKIASQILVQSLQYMQTFSGFSSNRIYTSKNCYDRWLSLPCQKLEKKKRTLVFFSPKP